MLASAILFFYCLATIEMLDGEPTKTFLNTAKMFLLLPLLMAASLFAILADEERSNFNITHFFQKKWAWYKIKATPFEIDGVKYKIVVGDTPPPFGFVEVVTQDDPYPVPTPKLLPPLKEGQRRYIVDFGESTKKQKILLPIEQVEEALGVFDTRKNMGFYD